MKQVSKVVVYFTDGTYQEVGGNFFGGGGGGAPTPFQPQESLPDIWKKPGEIGKWPFPPDGTGITIVD